MCSSYDNTLSNCSTKHMQVLQKELLQAGILELDTLPFLIYSVIIRLKEESDMGFFMVFSRFLPFGFR